VDNIPVAKAEELGIWVATAQAANANTVAEAAVTFIAALCKRFKEIDLDFTVKGNYNIRNQLLGNDLEGKVVSILGFGRIGRLVAQKCALGFGMKILAYDPYIDKQQLPDYVEAVGSWDHMFEEGDFVSIHMPFNGNKLVTSREFNLMKPTAYFINVARGALVDESALYQALQDKKIAGAGLDVYDPEPPNKDNPLLHMDNVIAQPHSAALTKECTIRMALHAAQNVDDVLSGKEPTWPYNRPAKLRKGV
jgi:D-3-phosphoglycerate dehydrogenase